MKDPVAWYDKHASTVAAQYESVKSESLYEWLTEFLPKPPALVLDVGAGSGRDAAWLAAKGYEVFAIEPSKSMRRVAKMLHPAAPVRWVHDSLPKLDYTVRSGLSFDVILLSGVWMHVPPGQRPRAFRKLVNLLRPGGIIAISLRIGPEEPERGMYGVDSSEIESLAKKHGTIVHRAVEREDLLGRDGVRWKNYVLRFPDDGTGALPLLRHVILNDDKSSTYKLGLLRSICRIADGSAGLVRLTDDDRVSIPLGLVALTWLRLYKPLLAADFPQNPRNISGGVHLGFAREALDRLAAFSHLDMRVGIRLGATDAVALHRALRDAARTIRIMPARHMTFPDGTPILPVSHTTPPPLALKPYVIDEPYLRSFGEMLVPWRIWQAVQRFAVWIEPALVEEWIRLMQGYAETQGRDLPRDRAAAAMIWSDPTRDVAIAKRQARDLLESSDLHCVWSGKRLSTKSLDLDHCFPWSAWPCSDLWNLMPANRSVNQREKGAKLPSATLMLAARDRIMSWWEAAYGLSSPLIHKRFALEAASSLPGVLPLDADLDSCFEGAFAQRAKLRYDQRVPEWSGEKYVE
ncbi:MAG: methyltransferase domain-containing protein [Acidobacteriia bacterium]|nr:methyltransferase domain-containing protein [Terriglobia bacterium]